ncbi:MAG: hypothetical protein Q6373_022275 [Candidatus Sigynarchaeota archaeon]
MGSVPWETLVIKHSRLDRAYVITSKSGGHVGSIICNQTPDGLDIYIVDASHEVTVLLEAYNDMADSVAFLVPVGNIVDNRGKFRLLGRLARSTGRRDNKFVFQPVTDQDVFVIIGSALSRSCVVRRKGVEIASFVKTGKYLEITMNSPLLPVDKAIVIGIGVATSLQAELASALRGDMKLPTIIQV